MNSRRGFLACLAALASVLICPKTQFQLAKGPKCPACGEIGGWITKTLAGAPGSEPFVAMFPTCKNECKIPMTTVICGDDECEEVDELDV